MFIFESTCDVYFDSQTSERNTRKFGQLDAFIFKCNFWHLMVLGQYEIQTPIKISPLPPKVYGNGCC
jgi:hypothetical protein